MANRIDISFPSEGGTCTGWLYSPKNAIKQPTLLMAHGLGATKEMALDSYAETFSSAGFVCIVFDYRHFGTSTGQPRYLIDIELQNKDWKSAIKYAKTLKEVDPQRLGLFGTSFSGGQVIRVAAECPNDIAAVVAQCPFSSGFRSALTTSKIQAPYMFFQAVRDYFFGTPEHPYLLPLAGEPGSPALMSAPDVVEGYTAIIPQDFDHPNTTPARIVLNLIRFFPGAYAKDVKCPIFFGICRKDSVAPASATISYAKQAPKGEVKVYEDMGHFDIYTGEKTQRARKDYLNFLKSHL